MSVPMTSAIKSVFDTETLSTSPPKGCTEAVPYALIAQRGQASITLHTVPRNLLTSPHTDTSMASERRQTRFHSLSAVSADVNLESLPHCTGKSGYRRIVAAYGSHR